MTLLLYCPCLCCHLFFVIVPFIKWSEYLGSSVIAKLLYISLGNHQARGLGRVEIPLNSWTLPHMYAFSSQDPIFIAIHHAFIVFNDLGLDVLFVVLILVDRNYWPSLLKFLFHNLIFEIENSEKAKSWPISLDYSDNKITMSMIFWIIYKCTMWSLDHRCNFAKPKVTICIPTSSPFSLNQIFVVTHARSIVMTMHRWS